MYCSNCGQVAVGHFCSHCGAKLDLPPGDAVATGDWRQETRYEALLKFREVRDLIAAQVALARPVLSGEQFVELCDKALSPLMGIPLSVVTTLALPIYERLGIRTGKVRQEVLPHRPGEAIVAALCSLGRHGQKLKVVQQAEEGCGLIAELPSDIRSMTGGELRILLRRHDAGTAIEAITNIPGQLYDWGKSTQVLNQLFADLSQAKFAPRAAA